MSTAPTPIRDCDAALDYLYDMLEGEAKVRFEAHLATCPRCQAELEAFGKVRVAAKAAMPPVEPSERLTGALHVQLMHAAAQRKPAGKVLPFMRRVFRHPGYAAAAGILLVGGALGVQWSHGKLFVKTPAPVISETAAAPADEPGVGGSVVATPPAVTGLSKAGPSPHVKGTAAGKVDEGVDELASGTADKNRRAGKFEKESSFEMPKRKAAPEGVMKDAASADGYGVGSVGGAAAKRAYSPAPAKAIAPAAPLSNQAVAASEPVEVSKKAPNVPEQNKPAVRNDDRNTRQEEQKIAERGRNVDDNIAPATVANSAAEGASPAEKRDENAPYAAAQDALDGERARGESLAQAGRCGESVAVYESIERTAPNRLTARDRLAYVRCLRTIGRLDPAQGELDQLRANRAQRNALPAAALEAEQQAIGADRRRHMIANTQRAAKAKKVGRNAAGAIDDAPVNAAPDSNASKRAY